uniref:Dehydrogenase E1 component domain-containing protein n=1 Tax=Brassica oleracea var. oleracea TaxID=109376 RepID=A0A0D3BV40_BRAOL
MAENMKWVRYGLQETASKGRREGMDSCRIDVSEELGRYLATERNATERDRRSVDGMDAFAVKQACKFAKEHALKNGPIILEMDTYRYHGHSMSDPGSTYRTRDEISGVRQGSVIVNLETIICYYMSQERDPIERIKKLVLSHDLATEKELKDMEKEIRKEVDDAIAKAKDCSMPEPSELFTNVYVKGFGTKSFGADRKEVKAALP